MGSKLFYKLAPGDFLNGIHELKPAEIAAYVTVIMLNYEAGGYIADDPAMIARRYRTNLTGAKNGLNALVEMGRLKRATVDGRDWIYDERAISEMESFFSRAKHPRAVFKGKTEKVPANLSENLNENNGTDFIGENGHDRAKLDDFENQVRANLSQLRGISSRSALEIPLETTPIEELKEEKACTGANAQRSAGGKTEAISLEAMASDCQTAEQVRAIELIREHAIGIFDRTIVIERGWQTSHIDSKLGTILKAHRVAVAEDGSREASKAMQLCKSAGGSGG